MGLILAIGFTAGCTAPEDAPATADEAPNFSATETATNNPPSEAEVPGTATRKLIMDSCKGALSHAIVPAEFVGADPPETWGGGPTPLTDLWINVHQCGKISIDEFERGPVSMVLETHGNRLPPEDCRGDYTTSEVLIRIWLDDLELVEHLRTQYSMPAEFATITVTNTTTAEFSFHEATFGTADSPTSRFTEYRMVAGEVGPLGLKIRRFWENSFGGISFLDFTEHFEAPNQFVSPVMTGEVYPPFLYTNLGTTTYTPLGGFYESGQISGPIEQFGDLACKEPLP